jgi:hypothetical protein
VSVITRPAPQDQVELGDQETDRQVPPVAPEEVIDLVQQRPHVLGRGLEQHLGPITPHVLAQKVKAVFDAADPGLLVGEFETPLLQEVSHERLDLVTPEFRRCARDEEIIRVSHQMDLVP